MVFLRVRIITCGGDGDLVVDDPVEARLRGHAEHRFDRFGIDVMALVEPVVEADQHFAGARRAESGSPSIWTRLPRAEMWTPSAVLDGDQMAVVIAEQRPEQIGLLELELEPGAAGSLAATAASSRRAIRRPPAGASRRPWLFGPASSDGDVDDVAGLGGGFDMDRLQPRRLADHLAGVAARALDQDLRVCADLRRR